MPQIRLAHDPDFRIGDAWLVECLKRGGYLHPAHNRFISLAHDEVTIAETLAATDLAFEALKGKLATAQAHPTLVKLLAH